MVCKRDRYFSIEFKIQLLFLNIASSGHKLEPLKVSSVELQVLAMVSQTIVRWMEALLAWVCGSLEMKSERWCQQVSPPILPSSMCLGDSCVIGGAKALVNVPIQDEANPVVNEFVWKLSGRTGYTQSMVTSLLWLVLSLHMKEECSCEHKKKTNLRRRWCSHGLY